MINQTQNIAQNGDIFLWDVEICNNSDFECKNANFAITIPVGVEIYGPRTNNASPINVPVGYYDENTHVWNLGDIDARICEKVTFSFIVADITKIDTDLGGFQLLGKLSSNCIAECQFTSVIAIVEDGNCPTKSCEGCGSVTIK